MEDLKVQLSDIVKRLDINKGSKKDKDSASTDLIIETDIRNILLQLSEMISSLFQSSEQTNVSNALIHDKVSNLESKLRIQDDVSDHHHQRSLRGKFFVSFPGDFPCTSEKDLSTNGSDVMSYTSDLVFNKYGVQINPNQYKTCHHTKKGLIFRLQDLSPGSAFAKLTKAIKNGQGKDNKSYYVNFSLTPRRAALLYDLRKGKRELKLDRFYSDSDGSLSYVLDSNEPKKIKRITSLSIRDGSSGLFYLKTLSPEELQSALFRDEEQASDPNILTNHLSTNKRGRGRPPKSRSTSGSTSGSQIPPNS